MLSSSVASAVVEVTSVQPTSEKRTTWQLGCSAPCAAGTANKMHSSVARAVGSFIHPANFFAAVSLSCTQFFLLICSHSGNDLRHKVAGASTQRAPAAAKEMNLSKT